MLDTLLNTIFVNSVIWILKTVFYIVVVLPFQLIAYLIKFIAGLFSEEAPSNENKFNLSGSVFTGPVQVGDGNAMIIDEFTSFVETHQINHAESYAIKSLLITTQKLVTESKGITRDDKFEATTYLYEIAVELAKPQTDQNTEKIKDIWRKFINIVKDIGAILSVATSLAKILGLPLP